MKTKLLQALLCAVLLGSGPARGQVTFAHWTSASDSANTAAGTLGAVAIALTTDNAVPDTFGNGGVVGGIFDGSSTNLSANHFLPNIASTDVIGVGGASSFTLRFSPAITNPVLHIYQIANNTWSFTDGTNPISFTLISSDGNFTVPTGTVTNTITGVNSLTDSSGSLAFPGVFTRISWISNAGNNQDGVDLQISTSTSRPTIQVQQGGGGSLRSTLRGLLPGQIVVWQTSFDLAAWSPFQTNTISGTTLSITNLINLAIPEQFFRAVVQ